MAIGVTRRLAALALATALASGACAHGGWPGQPGGGGHLQLRHGQPQAGELLSAIHRLPELRTLAKLMGPLRGAGRPGPPVKARRSATAGR